MTAPTGITISVGLPEALRAEAAALYLDAFSQKLRPILGNSDSAERFLSHVQRPSCAIVVLDDTGALIGIAGFHDSDGGFIGGGFRDLARYYGHFGAAWRALALSVFEREPAPDEMLMDGVVVTEAERGQGIGSLLLNRLEALAIERGKSSVRLDVVDKNPRARALYERRGYVAIASTKAKFLRPFFGFGGTTTMRLHVRS